MLVFEKEMFLDSESKWQSLYAEGLAWCASGIKGLSSSGIAPFHIATPLNERDNSSKVVYAIYDEDSDEATPSECFFEDDYIEGFYHFSQMKNATLYVSFLKVGTALQTASQVWTNNEDYLEACHGNYLHWNLKHKSWML